MSDIQSIAAKNNFYMPECDPVTNQWLETNFNPEDEMQYRKYRLASQVEKVEIDKKVSMVKGFIKHNQLAKAYINAYGKTIPMMAVFANYDTLMDTFIAYGYRREMTGHIISELRYQYSNIIDFE